MRLRICRILPTKQVPKIQIITLETSDFTESFLLGLIYKTKSMRNFALNNLHTKLLIAVEIFVANTEIISSI